MNTQYIGSPPCNPEKWPGKRRIPARIPTLTESRIKADPVANLRNFEGGIAGAERSHLTQAQTTNPRATSVNA
jgi:hypothetical protein